MKLLKRHADLGPIAIDIGSSGVKMLQIDNGRDRPTVTAAAWRALPAGASAEERELQTVAAIAESLRTAPFRGRRVVAALQPTQFQLKSFRLPRMPAEELESALAFEAPDRFAFTESGGQYRYICAGDVRQGNDHKDELIVFGVPESVTREMIARLEALRLEPEALDAAPTAMARSFARFLRREDDVAAINVFVDVGRSHTNLVITRGADVSFVKVIGVGGRRFDEAVAARLGITPAEAGEMRLAGMIAAGMRRRGSAAEEAVPPAAQEQVADAIRPVVEQLAREVQLCLRYFAVTFRGQKPGSITFVGGEAHEPSLAPTVSEMVDLPCLVGDPLRGISATPATLPAESWTFRPGWGVAVGLALRGSRWVRREAARAAAAVRGNG